MNRLRKISEHDRVDAIGPFIRHFTKTRGFFYGLYDAKTGLYSIEDVRDYSVRPILDRLIIRGREEGWLQEN